MVILCALENNEIKLIKEDLQMIILLMGPSGSGKTTTCKELEKYGAIIVPTYTTRKPRPDDAYTECISEDKFKRMIKDDEFVSFAMFHATFGDVYYGIPKIKNMNKFKKYIIIGAYEYYDDIIGYYGRSVYSVFVDVDIDTIIKKSMGDESRGESNSDLRSRLERDREKNIELARKSDLLIDNEGMWMSPRSVARLVYYSK